MLCTPFQPPTPCTQDGAVHLLQAHEARSLGQDQHKGNNCNIIVYNSVILVPTEGALTLPSVLKRMAAIIGCEGVS